MYSFSIQPIAQKRTILMHMSTPKQMRKKASGAADILSLMLTIVGHITETRVQTVLHIVHVRAEPLLLRLLGYSPIPNIGHVVETSASLPSSRSKRQTCEKAVDGSGSLAAEST